MVWEVSKKGIDGHFPRKSQVAPHQDEVGRLNSKVAGGDFAVDLARNFAVFRTGLAADGAVFAERKA